MFENPGGKIKVFAQVLFWIMVVLGAVILIVGCTMGTLGATFIIYGIIIIVMGYFLSLLYAAFGELAEDVREIKTSMKNGGNPQPQGYCTGCGTQNDPNNKFCARCGKPLN